MSKFYYSMAEVIFNEVKNEIKLPVEFRVKKDLNADKSVNSAVFLITKQKILSDFCHAK